MLPFIDAHFHLWDLKRLHYAWLTPPFSDAGPNGNVASIARDYLPSDYRADLRHWNLIGAVHVDAGADPAQAIAETDWLEQLSDVGGLPSAIVAYADLTAPDIDAQLAAQAQRPRVRGIRQIVNWHADAQRSYTPADLTLDPAWERGFARLAGHGLSFDLQCYPAQVPHLAAILARYPEVAVMVNHLGMPVLDDPDGAETWRTAMRLLAELEQVAIKISGMGFIRRAWDLDLIRPFVSEALDLFGTERAMIASDTPTDKLFASIDRHLEAYASIVADCSEAERRALFAGNANRLYRLDLDSLVENVA